ncbi:MAG: hypothetical protein GX580_14685, partial [Candidatus Hydrogenedens sp.]|nr:hypothetical protein [Candidatus Hydrogenedens sp.]
MARKTVSKPELHALVAQHGQAGAADILGVTPAAVSKRLSTEGRQDSVETLRRERIKLVRAQREKADRHNDMVAGRTVWK